MTKNEAISNAILNKISSVATVEACAFNDAFAVKKAIDYVLGQGTYDKLVSDLYDELREKAK